MYGTFLDIIILDEKGTLKCLFSHDEKNITFISNIAKKILPHVSHLLNDLLNLIFALKKK